MESIQGHQKTTIFLSILFAKVISTELHIIYIIIYIRKYIIKGVFFCLFFFLMEPEALLGKKQNQKVDIFSSYICVPSGSHFLSILNYMLVFFICYSICYFIWLKDMRYTYSPFKYRMHHLKLKSYSLNLKNCNEGSHQFGMDQLVTLGPNNYYRAGGTR